jgi:tRNA (Thr-GGU) A37 N-methylase
MFDLSRFGVKTIRIVKGERLEEKINDLERDKIIIVIYVFDSKDQRDALYELFKTSQKMVTG